MPSSGETCELIRRATFTVHYGDSRAIECTSVVHSFLRCIVGLNECIRDKHHLKWLSYLRLQSNNRSLFANTYELHHCVWHATPFSSRLELMVKLRTSLTVFTFILKAKASYYGKGRYIYDSCLWCSANHYALCQLANQSRLRLSGGGTL